MTVTRLRASLFPILLAACVGCGPFGPVPGGHLSGEVGPRDVQDWSFASVEETAQLETRPLNPHSVNVWFLAAGPRIYVPTSMIRGPTNPAKRGWVSHVEEDPRVRIRLAGVVYERVATRVTDPQETEKVRAALEEKYQLGAADRDPQREIWVFRLDPRPS